MSPTSSLKGVTQTILPVRRDWYVLDDLSLVGYDVNTRNGVIVIDYSFLSDRNRLSWPKMKCNRSRLNRQFNRNRRLLSRSNLVISPYYITVRWTAVVVAEFPPLSSFGMVMFQGRLFVRLCGLNPDSSGASTAFGANSSFVPAIAFLMTAWSNAVSLFLKTGSHFGNRIAGHYEERCSYHLYIFRLNVWM